MYFSLQFKRVWVNSTQDGTSHLPTNLSSFSVFVKHQTSYNETCDFLGCATTDKRAVNDDKADFEGDCQVLSC